MDNSGDLNELSTPNGKLSLCRGNSTRFYNFNRFINRIT